MRFLILGAGSLGCVVGGLLAEHGHSVALVGRARVVDALRDRGVRVSGIWGEHATGPLRASTRASDFADVAHDVVLIAVKSFDTVQAVEDVAPCVGPDTLVVSYQNGLGNADCIAERFGWERTVGARVIFGARMHAPAEVEVTVIAKPTALGVFGGGVAREDARAPAGDRGSEDLAARVRALAETMDAAGIPTVYTDHIAQDIWEKVAYNCALNPLSALLDTTYGGSRDTPSSWVIMQDIVREVYAVAAAMGIALNPPSADAYITLLHDVLIPPTAVHYASMHADLKLGHRTEIDALNGAIVRFGKQHGVACPVNAVLTRMIKAREELQGR